MAREVSDDAALVGVGLGKIFVKLLNPGDPPGLDERCVAGFDHCLFCQMRGNDTPKEGLILIGWLLCGFNRYS